jgi:hypothetical protein
MEACAAQAVAELGVGLIGEPTKAALMAAKQRGVRLGVHGAEILAPKYRAEANARAEKIAPGDSMPASSALPIKKSQTHGQFAMALLNADRTTLTGPRVKWGITPSRESETGNRRSVRPRPAIRAARECGAAPRPRAVRFIDNAECQ